jgi:RHS repeat-associated protein
VRQLAYVSGEVVLARAYDPYGVTAYASGASRSTYGFTGEYATNDLVYLRARFYAAGTGRFLTRDAWSGDANRPRSFNLWNYTYGNPVNQTDPSGHCVPPDGYWLSHWNEWPYFWWGPCPETSASSTMPPSPTPNSTATMTSTCTVTPTFTPTPYIEPWKKYKDYDKTTNSVPYAKWGALDSDTWDIARAKLVMGWLREAGKVLVDKDLTAWLLWREGTELFSQVPSDNVYEEGGGQAGAKLMIRYMHRRFLNGIDENDLGKFTPFYNPAKTGTFNQRAWDLLLTPAPYYPFGNTVKAFWGLEPLSREITWWEPGEPGFDQYTPDVTVRHPDGSGDILYFAYK